MANFCDSCGEGIEEGDEIKDEDGNIFCCAMCLEEYNDLSEDDL